MTAPIRPAAGLAAFLFLTSFALPAGAHVTVQPNTARAGSYARVMIRIPHGCDGAATVSVRVRIPNGVLSVKPQPKPGWRVEIIKRKLRKPVEAGHGHAITETVGEVVWRGGPLLDAHFDDFGLSFKLPDAEGTTLYFKTVQECERGVARWVQIPRFRQSWDSLHRPAPFLKLRAD